MSFALKKADPYRLYLFMGAIWAIATSMIFTILSVYYVQEVGMSPLQLVLVGTTLETTYFLFEVPTGIVADVYSRRLSVIIAYILLGIAFLIEGLVPIFAVILVAEVIAAIGYTFESGALQAWLADEIGEAQLGPALLRSSQIMRAAGFVGIFAGVALASLQLKFPIIAGGITLIVLGFVLALVMPETGFKPAERTSLRADMNTMGKTLRSSFRALRFNRIVLMFFTVELFWGSHSEGFDRLWEAHFLKNFTFPAIATLDPVVWFGIFRAGGALLSIVLAEYIRRRVDMTNQRQMAQVLFLSYTLVLIGVLGFGLANSFGLALAAFWLVHVARSVGGPVTGAWLNQNIPSESRATLLSIVGQGNALGQIAGGPGVGWIGTARSLRAAMVTCSLLLLPAAGIFGRAARRPDATPAPAHPLVEEQP